MSEPLGGINVQYGKIAEVVRGSPVPALSGVEEEEIGPVYLVFAGLELLPGNLPSGGTGRADQDRSSEEALRGKIAQGRAVGKEIRVPPIVGIESGEDFSLYTVIKTFVIKEVLYAGNPPLLPES